MSRSVPCRHLARAQGWVVACSTNRPGQTGVSESCIQLRALAAHKDLAWEDSSASKAVLGGARVELAGSLVAEEDRLTGRSLARNVKLASSGQ